MTKRTIQFYGQGWGVNTTEITATFQGQTVYTGPVPTFSDVLPQNEMPVLFSVDSLDVTDQGAFAVTITPTSGDLVVSYVLANYTLIINPIYSWEQWEIITDSSKQAQALEIISSLANPPFSDAEIEILVNPESTQQERDAILAAHGVSYTVSTGPTGFSVAIWDSDSRTNVTINGEVPIAPPVPRPANLQGDWVYYVLANQPMAFDLNIVAGLE